MADPKISPYKIYIIKIEGGAPKTGFCSRPARARNEKLRRESDALSRPGRDRRKKSKTRFYGIFMVAQVAWLRDDEYLTARIMDRAAWARLVL